MDYETTPFKMNKKIKHLIDLFDLLLEWPIKRPTKFELTHKQYDDYMETLTKEAKQYLRGSPKYKGIEIKRMGEK